MLIRVRQALTKKIVQRIEQTMAARASTDSGGLQVVSAEGVHDGHALRRRMAGHVWHVCA